MLFVASDHAGFELKKKIIEHLKSEQPQLELKDLGTDSAASCDYPTFAQKVADAVKATKGGLGLLICGTGIGMSIAANKVSGIRAAAASEPYSARLAREHNDANVLCLGGRVVTLDQALACLQVFMSAKFDSTGERHQRRLKLIAELEK